MGNRPVGRALVVAPSPGVLGVAQAASPSAILHRMGFATVELADPYAAVAELVRRGREYRAVVLSLQSLFREELAVIGAVKSRFPQVEVWLTHTDGRTAALAEAMRLGVDGLLSEEGLHRTAAVTAAQSVAGPAPVAVAAPAPAPMPAMPRPMPTPMPVPVGERSGLLGMFGGAGASANGNVAQPQRPARVEEEHGEEPEPGFADPVLTAEELRALLSDDALLDGGQP